MGGGNASLKNDNPQVERTVPNETSPQKHITHTMKPYSPSCKLAVRDSLDDEYSDDVEDDVFIRDGKSAKVSCCSDDCVFGVTSEITVCFCFVNLRFQMSEENGLKRPLMAPRRQKPRANQMASLMKKRARFWKCCEPFCYGFLALVVLIGTLAEIVTNEEHRF